MADHTHHKSRDLSANGLHRPVAQNGTVHEDEISFREIFEILLKGKWVILATFALVVSAVTAYTMWVDPEYEAYSTVFVNQERTNLDEQLGGLFGVPNRNIYNEIEMLKAMALADRVAIQFVEHHANRDSTLPILLTEEGRPASLRSVANRLKTATSIEQINPDVDHIKIKATSTVPREAMMIANLYAEEYKFWRLEASQRSLSETVRFLQSQESLLKDSLDISERKLQDFLEHEEVVALDQQAELLVEQIAGTEVERDKATLDIEVERAKLRNLELQLEEFSPGIQRRLASSTEREIGLFLDQIAQKQFDLEKRYLANPALRGNEGADGSGETSQLVNEIESLQRQVEEKARKFVSENGSSLIAPSAAAGEGDPSGIRSQLSVIADLNRQILDKRIGIGGLEARQQVFNQRLREYEVDKRRLPNTSIQLAELQREYTANEAFYTILSQKLQESKVAESAAVGDIEIIDVAVEPTTPVRPKKALNILLGLVLGLALGVGIVFVRNALDNRIYKPEDLRKKGYSVVGIVPSMERMIKKDFKGKDRITFEGHTISTAMSSLLMPLSPASESFRRLRTNVEFSKVDSAVRTVLVSSPAPGEGKTVTALNLAVTMAQGGRKTVYVDADLRRPTGHKMIEQPKEPGLTDILLGSQAFKPSDFYTGLDYLYMIPAGSSVPNPAEFIGSRRMRDLVAQLRNEFDMIVFDTPPILAVTDAMLLAKQADVNILVVSAGETNWYGVERSVETLSDVGAHVQGIVLNRFDVKSAYGYYSYYNSYGYYEYYGEGSSRTAGKTGGRSGSKSSSRTAENLNA